MAHEGGGGVIGTVASPGGGQMPDEDFCGIVPDFDGCRNMCELVIATRPLCRVISVDNEEEERAIIQLCSLLIRSNDWN